MLPEGSSPRRSLKSVDYKCRAEQPNKQGKGSFVEAKREREPIIIERVSQLLQRDLDVSVHKRSY